MTLRGADDEPREPTTTEADAILRCGLEAAVKCFKGVTDFRDDSRERTVTATLRAIAAVGAACEEAGKAVDHAAVWVETDHIVATAFWMVLVDCDVDIDVHPYSAAGDAIAGFALAYQALRARSDYEIAIDLLAQDYSLGSGDATAVGRDIEHARSLVKARDEAES